MFDNSIEFIIKASKGWSIEITPSVAKRIIDFSKILKLGTKVNVTHLPGTSPIETIETSKQLYEQGMLPVPHLAVRSIQNLDALEILIKQLSEKAKIKEILIRKMLWEVVRSVDFHQHIDNKKIFYFVKQGEFIGVKSFFTEYESFLKNNKDGSKAFKLLFKQDFNSANEEKYIKRPTAIGTIIENPKDYKSTLSSLNEPKGESTILIDGSRYEKYLYQTLVVEKIVEMNPGILDNIADYNAGLQIVFPSAEIIQKESFVLDEKVARHLYENINYNKAFDLKFIEGIEKINDRINSYK